MRKKYVTQNYVKNISISYIRHLLYPLQIGAKQVQFFKEICDLEVKYEHMSKFHLESGHSYANFFFATLFNNLITTKKPLSA